MSRWAVASGIVLLALGGCTGPGSARPTVSGTGTPAANAAAAAPSKPIPRGNGGRLTDDLNGDGYPELQIPVALGPGLSERRTGFLFGSAQGVRRDVYQVWSSGDLGVPPPYGADPGALTTGDLDDDGFAEVMMVVNGQQAPRDPLAVRIAWGTPTGPVERGRTTVLTVLPAGKGTLDASIATGDFDGDGRHDLAILYAEWSQGPERFKLDVRYGPFTRDGRAARTDSRPASDGFLIADRIDPKRDRPTDLLLQQSNDGEQSANTLFTGGAKGLAEKGIELRGGSGHAFGDFDGDGRRDIAVGDDAGRNDEPGAGTEPPTVDQSVNVHYATDFAAPKQVRVPGIRGGLAAADTDGDGRDELGLTLGTPTGPVPGGPGAPGAPGVPSGPGGTGVPPGGTGPMPDASGGVPTNPVPTSAPPTPLPTSPLTATALPGGPGPGASGPGAGGPGAGGPSGPGASGPGAGGPGAGGPGAGGPGAGAPGASATGALAVTLGPNGPERQTSLRHTMPATVDGKRIAPENLEARVRAAGDFDADGRGEFVLLWDPGAVAGRMWVTDGTRDKAAFTTTGYRD